MSCSPSCFRTDSYFLSAATFFTCSGSAFRCVQFFRRALAEGEIVVPLPFLVISVGDQPRLRGAGVHVPRRRRTSRSPVRSRWVFCRRSRLSGHRADSGPARSCGCRESPSSVSAPRCGYGKFPARVADVPLCVGHGPGAALVHLPGFLRREHRPQRLAVQAVGEFHATDFEKRRARGP